MNRLIQAALALLLSISCAHSGGDGRPALEGRVVDANGVAVVGAEVSASGAKSVRTNTNGRFAIRGRRGTVPVSVRATGFIDTTRFLNDRVINVVVVWPRAAAQSLKTAVGGTLTFPGGTVEFPPNAFVEASGRRVDGEVQIAMTLLDVSDPRQVRNAPGDFRARMRDGAIRPLETFGVFEVIAETPSEQRVELARDRSATVAIRVPPRVRPPREVGLFSFEPATGLWVEQGTMSSTATEKVLISSLRTLGTWNADQVLLTTCIKVRILACDNATPAVNALVAATGADYSGFSQGIITDPSGEICLSVKRNARVTITATLGGREIEPVELATPNHVASAADCASVTQCPLELSAHLGENAALHDDLNTLGPDFWAAHNWTNNTGDPNFNVGWHQDHVSFASGEMTLMLSDYGAVGNQCTTPSECSGMPYASGESRTHCFYGYGKYEATFRTAAGSGLLTTFFTLAHPSDGSSWHDEIDVEIFGRAPNSSDPPCAATHSILQTHYYAKGISGPEQKICLGFDASAQNHTYRFEWSPNDIQWFVDNQHVHTETRDPGEEWPILPGRIVTNLWAGTTAANLWLGPFTYSGIEIRAHYDTIDYQP
ncbi:MAG TPA: family 16 glycosylhydrolase [Thermoanaerobaculia bacterium]|jgi:beta-glucanase (GH16 family)|nr:family 16 glycosylhydrolase [Thermoanaerobaculia bacterium]